MTSYTTPAEQAQLNALRTQMNAIARSVHSTPVRTELGDLLDQIAATAPQLVTPGDRAAFAWLGHTTETKAYDALVAKHNEIVSAINARVRAARDARAAAKELAAVRAAMCSTCFTVHAGDCY